MMRWSAVLLSGAALLAQRVPEAAEPNDTPATSSVLGCRQEASGQLSSASDVDYYRIVLSAAADLVATTGPGADLGNDCGDTVLTLVDASGGALRANDDGVARGYYSELAVPDLAAGTYYLVVGLGPNGAASGSYVLDVSCASPASLPVPLVVAEAAEPNDPRIGGTATSVLPPARLDGFVSATGHSGDWDFYRLLVLGDSVLRIRAAATATHVAPAEDLVIYLFDGSTPPNLTAGPFYASARDAWDQAIDVRVPGGFQHIAVRGVEGSLPGDYYLDVARDAAATAVVHPGGCFGRTLGLPTTSFGVSAQQAFEAARFGSTYVVEGSNLGGNAFVFHVIGVQATFIDLTPFGAVGCALEVVNLDTVLAFADPLGRASWAVPVPSSTSLVGTPLHSQAAVLDFSNPLGITISNRVTATLGS